MTLLPASTDPVNEAERGRRLKRKWIFLFCLILMYCWTAAQGSGEGVRVEVGLEILQSSRTGVYRRVCRYQSLR